MSNSDSEFISTWNEIFTFKIVESDLKRPTEQFVFNALVSYLRLFNIDLTPLIEEKNGDLSFKIKFCKYIDHYYKISDKSNSFLYYDLIHPSPKKTAHMLKYLLNYGLYYNNVKAEIVNLTDEKIREHADLLRMRNEVQSKNEKLNIKQKSIEKSIKEHSNALPKLKAQIENLQSTENTQLEQIRELQEICRNCESVLLQLKTTEQDLKKAIVSKDEVDILRTNESSLQKALIEQEEIESTILASNQTRSDAINKLSPIMKEIASAMELYPHENLLPAKKARQKLSELIQKYAQQKSMNETKNADIKIYSKKLEELEQKIKIKVDELQNTLNVLENNVRQKNECIEKENKLSEILSDKLGKLEEEIATQQDNCNYILELAEEICQRMRLNK